MVNQIAKYRIVGELGKGGMGIVYKGVDPVIGRTVAVKTIRFDVFTLPSGREEAQKRFIREAQAAGNLSHPNIVTIYDVGEDKGLIYIAMEFIEGLSLSDLIARKDRLPVDEIMRLLEQIADGLDYAHRKGIVHRDIKPGNILVGENGRVHIVDFGVARMSDSAITQSGMLMGTPRYMSPEQIAGKKIDSRADIFSLGAILYELLTGKNPFEGENITTVIYKIMHEDVPPLRTFDKELPAGFDRVVRKALAREPDSRYATCRQLYDDLKKYAGCGGVPRTAEAGPRPERRPPTFPIRLKKSLGSKRAPAVLGSAIVVLTILFLLLVLGGRKKPIFPVAPTPANTPAIGADSARTSSVLRETPAVVKEAPPPKTTVPAAGSAAKKGDPVQKTVVSEKPELPIPPAEEKTSPNAKGFPESVWFNKTVMVHIPPGEFSMGSRAGEGDDDEHPLHKVNIKGFWLSQHEVTFTQFDRFASETGRPIPSDEGWGRGERPAINVTWNDANAYCQWLSAKTGRTFRLPTEAEWEKTARFKFPWGGAEPDRKKANFKKAGDGYDYTAPVGSFPEGISSYGILDMAGNVWEWVHDWYEARFYAESPADNPTGPAQGQARTVRGGSWRNSAPLIRSANRSSEKPESRLNILGFRVAMDEKLP